MVQERGRIELRLENAFLAGKCSSSEPEWLK